METKYTPEFKTKVVLEALRSVETDTSVAQAYGVHPVTLSRWKTQLLHDAVRIFKGDEELGRERQLREELSRQIRQVEEELELLKRMVEQEVSIDTKMRYVQEHKSSLGLNRALDLYQLPKSTYYYRLDQD